VLALLRERLTNEQIAERLDVSLATAKYHVSEILSKLGVESREEAAVWERPAAPVIAWWQRLLAPLTLAKAAGVAASLAAAAGLAVLAWGVLRTSGDDDSAASATATATLGASPSVTPPADTVFEPLAITDPESTKLLFRRGQNGLDPGTLWLSDLDGANAEILIDEAVVSDVIAVVPHWQTGNPTVYYSLTQSLPEPTYPAVPHSRQTISTLDLVTGERVEVLGFEIKGNQSEAYADLKDGGRYIAYTDTEGLAIFDSASAEVRRVLSKNLPPECAGQEGRVPSCSTGFLRPAWSPDGSLLAVNQVFWESGDVLVVDVDMEPPLVTNIQYDGIYPFGWSPSGNALCAVDIGSHDETVGLIVSRPPNWQPEAFLTDYPSGLLRTPSYLATAYADEGMWGCVWLDEKTVAVMHDVFIEPGIRPKEILVLDLETSNAMSFQEHNEFTSSRDILAVPERNLLISQFQRSPHYPDPIGDTMTPEVVDAETGARAAILTTEDRVLAAIAAELLEP
jgi:hypothetical protein